MNRHLPTFSDAEEHVKISHFTKKGYDISGIVHVGTNDWYELQFYLQMGIEYCVGFEPLSFAVENFNRKYWEILHRKYNNVKLFPYAIGLEDKKAIINVASGDGQSSTFLELHPDYLNKFLNQKPIGTQNTEIRTFDTFLYQNRDITLDHYNCLVVDVEGMELDVLKSIGEHIKYFDFLNIECSGKPSYINGPLADMVVAYLDQQGFSQDTPIEDHNDIMFIKKGKST